MWNFPGSPVVRTRCFHRRGPGQETKIPQTAWRGQKKKKNAQWSVIYSLTNEKQPKSPTLGHYLIMEYNYYDDRYIVIKSDNLLS